MFCVLVVEMASQQ